MSESVNSRTEEIWVNSRLPLAIYREVAAHLRQVTGVEAELLPQTATSFDYTLSQVGGIRLHYAAADQTAHRRVAQILEYYGDRHGSWERMRDER